MILSDMKKFLLNWGKAEAKHNLKSVNIIKVNSTTTIECWKDFLLCTLTETEINLTIS